MRGFDHFDFIAPLYDRLFHIRDNNHLVELLRLPTGGLLLDAGGGTGRIAQTLRSYAGGVIIADVSRGMLQRATAKQGIQAVCSPSETLPFDDGTFDRILMVDALHHVYNAAQATSELWRVLKPGGRLLIEEPDINTIAVKIVAVMEKMALMRSHFISPAKIASFFEQRDGKPNIIHKGYTAWVIIDKEIISAS